ncbi:MarR family winged helix-turn-helix transcriptional regulator [Halanaerobium salsuginis]|jgi:DNA-binding MarR family transcriptional regulator|uniref:DNA-binding transcriptional regulator, MarR family n=1 Tax=Halanaerobium salsuginis TaxID=29563 RepID=A0A1I4JNQ5_9FIRM|nr:MarR family transcriptional regulator [Halanaerobium salsuginis]SFL67931.1 DNA-binding transcriptional regulator, MarR family [Halanaerobium salsuginis]
MKTDENKKKTPPELKLDNQLCFSIYAASRAIVNLYRPLLDELGLTYTQYITMLVLWEEKEITIKSLGQKLFLDSGTLTPLVKKLIKSGYLSKKRSIKDQRVVLVSLTKKGLELRQKARCIPAEILKTTRLTASEASELREKLKSFHHKMMKA